MIEKRQKSFRNRSLLHALLRASLVASVHACSWPLLPVGTTGLRIRTWCSHTLIALTTSANAGESTKKHKKRGSRSRSTLHTHAFANPATRCISSGYSVACGSLVLHGRASRGAIRTRRPGRAVTPVSLPSRSEFPEYLIRLAPARRRCCCLAESCSL